MYKEILEALKAKFPGVADSILGRVASRLAKTADTAEQVKTAVDGVTFQQVLESYGDSRATESAQTAVQNYESKHGLRDGKPAEGTAGQRQAAPQASQQATATHQQQQTGGGAEQTPEWARALVEANRALAERMARMEGDRTAAERRQRLRNVTAKLPDTLRKPYERTAVDTLTEEQFQAALKDIEAEVDSIAASVQRRGAVFGRPAAGGGTERGDALTKEQQAAIAQRDGKPADGQPF